MKKLIIGAVLFFVLLWIILWFILGGSVNKTFLESDAFKVTVEHIQSDSTFINSYGQLVKVDSSVAGKLKYEDIARFVFDVETQEFDITVTSELEFENNQWIITSIEYEK